MTACTLLVIQVRKNFKAKTEIVCVIGRVKKVFVKNRTSLSISTLVIDLCTEPYVLHRLDVRGSLLESRFSSQLIWCTFGHLIPIGSNGMKSILKELLACILKRCPLKLILCD